MMSAKRGETLDPPRRVEILRVEDQRPSSYFKVGQFGYARVRHTSGGFATQDAGESKAGQPVYAVSKAKDGRGGAVWFTEDGIRFTGRSTEKPRIEARQGRPVVKRGVRGIYEVLWYDTGAGEVRSLVDRTVIAEYTPGLGWEDYGRLPDNVREYAQQIASLGGVPHHETSGRSEPQPKKSHAQIKREVDEVLAQKPSSRSQRVGIQPDPGEWWDSLSRSDRQTVAEGSLAGSTYENAVSWLPGRTWQTIRPDIIREVLWKGLSRAYPTRRAGSIRV
jgi:hypothetical protein